MDTYKNTLALVFQNNPHLRLFRQKRFLSFFIRLFLLTIPLVGLGVYLTTVTEIALWVGVVAGMVLPWFVMKPQRLFTPRWLGTVQKIAYVQRRVDVKKTHSHAGGTFYTDMRDRTFIRVTVQDDKGRAHIFEKEQRYEQVYRTGDRVMAIMGLSHPIPLTPDEKTVCPRCGNIMPCTNEICVGCNAPVTTV